MLGKNKSQKAQKNKFYKQKWFWIVIAILLVFSLFGGNNNNDKKATDNSTDVVEEQTQEQKETQEQKKTESESTSTESNGAAITDDILLATLNSSYEGKGTWKTAGERHFAFYPEGDLADAFTFIGTYYAQYGEIPAELKENFDYMCNSIKDLSKTMSDTAGEPCALSIVNPSNTDNVLITYMNGTTLYNAFDE